MAQKQNEVMDKKEHSFWRRIGWFIALWLASVAVVSIVAYGIRLMIL